MHVFLPSYIVYHYKAMLDIIFIITRILISNVHVEYVGKYIHYNGNNKTIFNY